MRMSVVETKEPAAPPLIWFREFCGKVREPDWVIPDLIERGSHVVLFGDSNAGKSAIMLDWMCRLAYGLPIHGRVCHDQEPVGALYVANEGRTGLYRRIPAWAQAAGLDVHDSPDIPLAVLGHRQLLDARGVDVIIGAMNAFADSRGYLPSLITIDTLSASYAGRSQEDNAEMQRHCDMVMRLCECGPAVLQSHHTGHGNKERARGAASLVGSVDAELRAWVVSSRHKLTAVEYTKSREGQGKGRLAYRLCGIDLIGEFGDELGDAVVACEHSLPERVRPQTMRAYSVLEEIYALQVETVEQSGGHAGESLNVTREDWRDELLAQDVIRRGSARAIDKAVSRLLTELRLAAMVRQVGDGVVPLAL